MLGRKRLATLAATTCFRRSAPHSLIRQERAFPLKCALNFPDPRLGWMETLSIGTGQNAPKEDYRMRFQALATQRISDVIFGHGHSPTIRIQPPGPHLTAPLTKRLKARL